ncbi:MAG: hypothetical protein V7739_17370 [Motiliproteus sp.]
MTDCLLTAGTLMEKLIATTEQGIKSGALKTVHCETQLHYQAGIPFQIRVLSNTVDKARSLKRLNLAGNVRTNPFLPYEADMFVTDITRNRIVLLNKFNVVKQHALIVSREFQHQQSPLGLEDFYALSVAMNEFPSLGFYNGGKEAGASQTHRHMQLVPIECLGGDLPINPQVLNDIKPGFVYRLISNLSSDPGCRSEQLSNFYKQCLQELDLREGDKVGPFNMLVYKTWGMIVPRSQGEVEGIAINSLGYAGAFLAKDDTQLQRIKDIGCLQLLMQAGVPLTA